MCPPCERPPPIHPHLCICSLLYDSVAVVWPLGQKACEMAWLHCCVHSGGCSNPAWKKSLSNSMASLLLALCRLFSSLLLPTAILLVTGLQILHSRYTTIFRKKIRITSRQLQKEIFQTETNPRNSRGDENCTLAAGPTCCIHMTHNMSVKLHDIRITFNHM